jgi:hypothetical protein
MANTLLIAAPAFTAETGTGKRPGRYKLGPLYLTPRLELRSAGVQTNVFNSQTGAVPDSSVVLHPALAAAIPVGRRLRLTGDGYLDFNYFRRERSERSTDFGGLGRAELDVGSLTFFGAGGGSQAKQRFSIDLDQRVLRQEKWAAAGVKIAFTRRISSTASGTSRIHTFGSLLVGPDNVKEALDRNELTASAQLRYALTRQTTFLASADAIEDRFLSETGDTPRRVRSFRYLGGFELGERALINGKLLAGVREFPGTSGGAPSYRGPALAVVTSIPLLRFGRLVAAVERDVFYAVTSTRTREDRLRNSYVSTSIRGEPSVSLPFDLIARGSFGVEQAKYLLPYPSGDGFAHRVDHLWTAGGSLLRRLGGSASIGGTVIWARRVGNLPGTSYQDLRYGVQAEMFP